MDIINIMILCSHPFDSSRLQDVQNLLLGAVFSSMLVSRMGIAQARFRWISDISEASATLVCLSR